MKIIYLILLNINVEPTRGSVPSSVLVRATSPATKTKLWSRSYVVQCVDITLFLLVRIIRNSVMN